MQSLPPMNPPSQTAPLSPPVATAPKAKRAGAQVWKNRMHEAIATSPEALIAFARDLAAHQEEQAWKDWKKGYRLCHKASTNEVWGICSPDGTGRFIEQPYGRGYWSTRWAFGPTTEDFGVTIAATNQALWKLYDSGHQLGAEAIAAYVTPKHAFIAGLLEDVELGVRDLETGELIP